MPHRWRIYALAVLESENDRLKWLIGMVEARTQAAHVQKLSPEDIYLFMVTGSFLNSMLMQAKAIATLVASDLETAAGPNQRTMWELWLDWRHLLDRGDRRQNAFKVYLTASLEAAAFSESHAAQIGPEALEKIRGHIRDYAREHPDLYAEVVEQRRKRRFHWSGLSRAEMDRFFISDSVVYKGLSWEAHSVLGPLRDVRIDMSGERARFEFGQKDQPLSDPEHVAYLTSAALFHAWNDYARLWGFEAITPPT